LADPRDSCELFDAKRLAVILVGQAANLSLNVFLARPAHAGNPMGTDGELGFD
jgi:hypothetical protein